MLHQHRTPSSKHVSLLLTLLQVMHVYRHCQYCQPFILLQGLPACMHQSKLNTSAEMSCQEDLCTHRAKMMGFNAARIEWSVDGLATAPKTFTTTDCDIATTADIQASMLPPTTADTPQPTGTPTLPQQPPTTGTTGDVCSSDLPNTSTQDRYVYLVHYLCGQVCCCSR